VTSKRQPPEQDEGIEASSKESNNQIEKNKGGAAASELPHFTIGSPTKSLNFKK